MFKLLLVDDEPIIVEGLYEHFIDYKAGILDVYKAYSAQEALDLLNKRRIDIVITDIKMPEMDGLQLLEKIRQSWPDCKVIFLTGHDEFNYIYKAVRYEGVSYLLKTESYESIASLVDRYLEEIMSGYRNEELIRQAENKMKKALPLFQKDFLTDLVDGVEIDKVDQQSLDELEIPLNAKSPVILLVGSILQPEGGPMPAKSNLYTVSYLVEQCLSPRAALAGLIYRKNYILWLLQPRDNGQCAMCGAGREAALYFRNTLESVQYVCGESARLKVSFAIGCDAVPWNEIFINGTELISVLNGSMRQGMEAVVTDSQFRELSADESKDRQYVAAQLKKLDSLSTLLEQGNKDEFIRVFSEIEEHFTRVAPHGTLDYEAYYTISLLFISYMKQHGIMEFISEKYNDAKIWDSRSHATMEDAFAFFRQVADAIFETQIAETEKKSIASIQKVQDFIMNNLGENLSLNSLADMVYFNPKYLSRLFKQATGHNLSDYINDKKLARAKELLKKDHIKIHEIAKVVGYSSGPYFTKFFKKGANMTPQEYRDSAYK